MGAVLGKEPLEHKRDAVAQHRVMMPRKPQHHDLKRSRHDELTDTQQKDAQVSIALGTAVLGGFVPRMVMAGAWAAFAVARHALQQVDGGDRTPLCCPRTVTHMLQVVQRMLVAAAAAQLLWHFAIGPWWDKRRRRGDSTA